MNRVLAFFLTLSLALFFVSPAFPETLELAGEKGTSSQMRTSGYVRSFAMYSVPPWGGAETAMLETRLRLKLSGELTARLHAELAYELAPVWRENTPLPMYTMPYQGFSYRAGDLDGTLYPGDPGPFETFEVKQNLDRAFITYSGGSFDLSLGRQPVAFGSARAVNPTDVLAPYPLNTIAKEERIGVDALRLKVPLGQMSELDTGAIFGDDFRTTKSAAYIRLKGYALGTDISLMAMRFRDYSLYGLDLARSIGGAGTWLEAAHVFTNTPGDDYLSITAGAEYLFTDEVYGHIEYHRNGAGTTEKSLYVLNALKGAYTDGGVYLMGMNYLAPGINYQATPLLGISLSVMYNMDDRSALISPSVEYNAAEDVYIGMGGFSGTGASGTFPGQGSEFGSYADLWYTSFSYYF